MKRRTAGILALGLLFAGCTTTKEPLTNDISPEALFQQAQKTQEQAVSSGGYREALSLYQAFLERYPDQLQKVIEVEYEIAFIHYKLREYDQAEILFRAVLDKYETEQAAYYPEWPKVLSQKLYDELQSRKSKKNQETTELP